MLALCGLGGCRDNTAAPIRIVLGPNPADEVTLVPKASLAELIEVSSTDTTVLFTLTSAERTCEALPQSSPEAVGVAIRLSLPGGAKLEPGTYPVAAGNPPSVEGVPPPPEKPHALSTVKLLGRRQELRPGGDLEITQVDISPRGFVEGLLKFEFPGDAEHPATRVSGHFLAHFCRINRLR